MVGKKVKIQDLTPFPHEAFDPVAEDLAEDRMDGACRELVELKKFVGERPAWEAFEPAEMWEIDDDCAPGLEIARLAKIGEPG